MYQVGGLIGLAGLVTFAVRYADGQLHDGVLLAIALTHGYVLAIRIGAVVLVVAGLLVLLVLENVIATPPTAGGETISQPGTASSRRAHGRLVASPEVHPQEAPRT